MKIVGVAACTVGIAHTYIAQEKLELAGKNAGHEVKIETQGTIGVENELTNEDIQKADIVIIAADVKLTNLDRFKGKKVIQVTTDTAIKSPNKLIQKAEEVVNN